MKILVVEDDVDLLHMTRRALERLRYRVLVAGDGERALVLFREHEPQIDLVLSDVRLPKLDGLGLYRSVRERNDQVKFVLSSGSTSADLRSGGELDPSIPFIRKPWNLDDLAATLERALAS